LYTEGHSKVKVRIKVKVMEFGSLQQREIKLMATQVKLPYRLVAVFVVPK
jgi:hypothetical protein